MTMLDKAGGSTRLHLRETRYGESLTLPTSYYRSGEASRCSLSASVQSLKRCLRLLISLLDPLDPPIMSRLNLLLTRQSIILFVINSNSFRNPVSLLEHPSVILYIPLVIRDFYVSDGLLDVPNN